ncbi:MAG: hypothetical protein AB7D57_07050 [Desulfovibrionaceae bacterium]
MSPADLAALRRDIEGRFGTVHRFCRAMAGRLNRSTVYMVLAGTYPGDRERQADRIRRALDGPDDQVRREEAMFHAIKTVACGRCLVTRACGRCDELFRAQARAARAALAAMEGVCRG